MHGKLINIEITFSITYNFFNNGFIGFKCDDFNQFRESGIDNFLFYVLLNTDILPNTLTCNSYREYVHPKLDGHYVCIGIKTNINIPTETNKNKQKQM